MHGCQSKQTNGIKEDDTPATGWAGKALRSSGFAADICLHCHLRQASKKQSPETVGLTKMIDQESDELAKPAEALKLLQQFASTYILADQQLRKQLVSMTTELVKQYLANLMKETRTKKCNTLK